VIASTGARLQAAHPDDHAGLDAIGTWPEELLALARPLYARGLSVHLLPYYGPWLWEPIDAGFDLSRSCSTTQFRRAAQAAFKADGQVVPRLGSHSFRRGRAAELFHGGMSQQDLTRVLRHRSPMSALPYVPEAARVTAMGTAMRAAANRCVRLSRAGPGNRPAPPRRGAA
jgi:integrase